MTDKPYYSLDKYLRQRFGKKLYKLALSVGTTCPNRDGSKSTGGCIFCSESGSGDFAQCAAVPVSEQILKAKQLVEAKQKAQGQCYIAYFQSFTSTYAPLSALKKAFTDAINDDSIAVLSVATRPDCLPEPVIELLGELNKIKPVFVELGLQSSNDDTGRRINRCFDTACFDDAVRRLKTRQIKTIAHVIIMLPGETKEDLLQTIEHLNDVGIDGVKLQLLHVLKGTRLAEMDYETLERDEYIDLLICCIEHLSPDIVIHRITGDGAKKLLIAPLWSADKKSVLNAIHREMKARNSYQGRLFDEMCEHMQEL